MGVNNFVIIQHSQYFVLAGNDTVQDLLSSDRSYYQIVYLVITDEVVLISDFAIHTLVAVQNVVPSRPQEGPLHVQRLD